MTLAVVVLAALAAAAGWVAAGAFARLRRRPVAPPAASTVAAPAVDPVVTAGDSILEAVALAVDRRDPSSRGHVRRVQAYAGEIARLLELPVGERQSLRVAALLHDIGTLLVPDHILSKPGRLTEAEYDKVRTHPDAGVEILAPIGLPDRVLAMVRHHHERWDGTGYPGGLAREAIPLGARILAVADAFDAITSERAYRARMSPGDAAILMRAWAGIQFDPTVVQILSDHLESIAAAPERAVPSAAEEEPAGGVARHPAPPHPAPPHTGAAPSESDTALAADPGGFDGLLHHGIAPALRGREAGPRTPPLSSGPGDAFAAQREVYALYEIAQTLGGTLRLTDVLDLVVSRIAQLVPYRTCVVWLPQAAGDGLEARYVAGANAAPLRGRRLLRGEGISGWAAEHRSSRFSGGADLELAGTAVDPAGYSTVAAFPLLDGGGLQGVISLYFPAAAPCQDDHVRLMEIIARLASGAMHDGRLSEGGERPALADPITHLPNERFLSQAFDQQIVRSQQSGQPFAVVEMDLDEFGAVNKRFGSAVGDRLLMEIGRVLRSHLRERDVLARLEEDGYAALLPGSGFAAAALLAERLQQAVDSFALRVGEEGPPARAGLSVGISIYPLDGERLSELLERAALNRVRNQHARKEARAQAPNVVPFRGPGPAV